VLGGLLALISAVTFAITNASVRRGVISGSAVQATTLSIPVGVPVFLLALTLGGGLGVFGELPRASVIAFAVTGVTHFIIGRYANYRAIGAIGTNLAGPVMQFNLVVSLALAILFLGESLTPLRIVGILLIFAGPAVVSRAGVRRARQAAASAEFQPRMVEGYICAAIAAFCYGMTPVLLRYAGGGRGLDAVLAGGVISASTASVVILFLLALPGHWREVRGVGPEAMKWFLFSGVMVYVSQTFYYMALALTPVTIVAPISALNNIFRIHVSRWLNPRHEIFGPEVTAATVVSFLGVVVLSMSVDMLPLPPAWAAWLNWRWP
jgi:drug/metabolite transporter (DMT)-like permease